MTHTCMLADSERLVDSKGMSTAVRLLAPLLRGRLEITLHNSCPLVPFRTSGAVARAASVSAYCKSLIPFVAWPGVASTCVFQVLPGFIQAALPDAGVHSRGLRQTPAQLRLSNQLARYSVHESRSYDHITPQFDMQDCCGRTGCANLTCNCINDGF